MQKKDAWSLRLDHLNFADVISQIPVEAQALGQPVMGLRCDYEVLGFAEKARLAVKAPLRWRSQVRPCVFDKKSGVRLQLTEEEQAALQPLLARMRNGSTPFEVSIAFDLVAEAIYKRRLGYSFEWDRLASRTATEWDAWLQGSLRLLRW